MATDGKVHLEVSYVVAESGLASQADGKAASKSFTAEVTDPTSYSAIADAMSRALSELSTALAKAVLAEDRRVKKEKAVNFIFNYLLLYPTRQKLIK